MFVLDQCPYEYVGGAMFDALKFADLFLEKGIAPVAGGALEQSKWFVDVAYRWDGENGRLNRELGIR